jgi:hypothetical protein
MGRRTRGGVVRCVAMRFVLFVLVAATISCGDDSAPGPDGGIPDGGLDAGRPRTHEMPPLPGAFVAGVAEVRIPAPVGIGTMGFGAMGEDPSITPFADQFPGTTRSHGTLTFKAVALSRGPEHEIVFVRLDTVGIFQQLREAVLDELETRLDRRLDDALILAGNHTHSGPGRLLLASGALVSLADTFFGEFYDRAVDAIADVVEAAIADQAPAELGLAIAGSSEGHNDRRCENDPLDQIQESPDLPIIAIRREGRLDAIVASYGYHGTVLSMSDHTLSGDMGSVVEQKIAEGFDHPVSVLFFNSWGADMSPGDVTPPPGATGADLPDGFEHMDLLGDVIRDAIAPTLETLTYASDPEIRARTYRVRIDREVIGYEGRRFNFPHGGAFCGLGAEGVCDRVMPNMGIENICLPIMETDGLPKQTMLTAGRIGDLHFFTAPGEWSTALSAEVLDHIRSRGGPNAMMIGYANDYTGYSLGEADWFQGGYESSGALWGSLQGTYLAARARDAFDTFFDLWNEPPWEEPARVPPFSGYDYDPYVPETPEAPGTITTDVPATVGPTGIVSFTVNGTDPWLGVPVATLESDAGGEFEPVLRSDGTEVTTARYDAWADLAPVPTYAEMPRAPTRAFRWTISFPISRRASSSIPDLAGGTYRFRVRIPTTEGETTVETGSFAVE